MQKHNTEETQFNLAKAELNVSESLKKSKWNNGLIFAMFAILIVNLFLTLSLAGAFVTLNNNAARADIVDELSLQVQDQANVLYEVNNIQEVLSESSTSETK